MLLSLLLGAFLVTGGLLVRPRTHPDDVHVVGTVVRSWRGHALGRPAWRYEVEFRDAAGSVHRFFPAQGGREQRVGAAVPVVHRPHDPHRTARRVDGPDAWLHRLPLGAGAALLVSAAGPLLQR